MQAPVRTALSTHTQTSARKKIPVVATHAARGKQFIFVHWTRAQMSQTDSEERNDPPSPPGQEGTSVLTLQLMQHLLSDFLHLSAALNAAD